MAAPLALTGASDATELTIREAAGQLASPLQVRTAANALIFDLQKDGALVLPGFNVSGNGTFGGLNDATSPMGMRRELIVNGGNVKGAAGNAVDLVVNTAAVQTVNATEWRSNADVALAAIGPTGAVIVGNSTALGPGVWGGTGAPAAGLGGNGDVYLRADGGAGTAIYQKRAGAWVGIV